MAAAANAAPQASPSLAKPIRALEPLPPRQDTACGRSCVLCISPALSQRVTSPTPQRLNALPLTTMNDPGGPSRRPSAGGAASVSEEENISASGDEAPAVDNKLAVK